MSNGTPAQGERSNRDRKLLVVAGVVVLLGLAGWFFFVQPGMNRAKAMGNLTACKANLQNMAVTLDMYSADNNGSYPNDLQSLRKDYLLNMPTCPAGPSDTYSSSYKAVNRRSAGSGRINGAFILFCKGENHKPLLEQNFPAYASGVGLVERGPLPSEPNPAADPH